MSAFQKAVEQGDAEAMADALAADVVFRSPVVHRAYGGRDAVLVILRTVVEVFEGFRYTDSVVTDDRTVLFFSAHVGDREIEGIDALRFDQDGKVIELIVMIRPMSGLQRVAEEMGKRLLGA